MHHLLTLILMLLPFAAPDKEQNDSIVRLMSAQSAEMYDDGTGHTFRKVVGPARFLHNNTYLVCDTAIWDVERKIINAFGNVQILQDETVLSSEKLDYFIDRNTAEFRGDLVQLQDKDNNTLRTRYLDYNTKDSVAIFSRGGSMRDGGGQLIESYRGNYDSKTKIFVFESRVNMFSDSVFVKSAEIAYHSKEGRAYFNQGVDAWKNDNMLSSEAGYYSRFDSTFFFTSNVHAMTATREVWADSAYVYRGKNNVLLLGNAQVKDSTRRVAALADYIFYEDSLSRITLKKNATLVAESEHDDIVDTVYVGADQFVYLTRKKCDIEEKEIRNAESRLSGMNVDPVAEYRSKKNVASGTDEEEQDQVQPQEQEEEVKLSPIEQRRQRLAAKQAKKQKKAERRAAKRAMQIGAGAIDPLTLADTLATLPLDNLNDNLEETEAATPDGQKAAGSDSPAVSDSLSAPSAIADSLGVANPSDTTDSTAALKPVELPDTAKVGFVFAKGRVRAFRKDIQMRCDSLIYSDLDSMARLFREPIIWNAGNRQYTADSVFLVIKNSRLDKANLSSNAFVIIKEDSISYDQIRGTEIMAYFDSVGTLSRFDALGGASAVFYIEENDALATANKVETKMLSAVLDSGQVRKIYYYDNPKNNAYPTMQLPKDDKQMKGFKWNPDDRPAGRYDITHLMLKDSERTFYSERDKSHFPFTRSLFPGYIEQIEEEIAFREEHKNDIPSTSSPEEEVEDSDKGIEQKPYEEVPTESTSAASSDTTRTDKPSPSDSLAQTAPQVSDSVAVKDSLLIPRDKWEERMLKRMAKQEAREARWAELDARDAEKAAVKEEKAKAKKRANTLKRLRAAEREAAKDQKKLDRYVKRFQKKYAKQLQRKG